MDACSTGSGILYLGAFEYSKDVKKGTAGG
jgi:hypothetical protein